MPSHTDRAHSVKRWSLPLPAMYYVLETKLQTSCRDIVAVTWTLLSAIGMLLTQSQYTPPSINCCIQFHTKAQLVWKVYICNESFGSSNAEQHILSKQLHHNIDAEPFKNISVSQVILFLSMLACREDFVEFYTVCSFYGTCHCYMPSATIQWTLQQHSRPALWEEQLKYLHVIRACLFA